MRTAPRPKRGAARPAYVARSRHTPEAEEAVPGPGRKPLARRQWVRTRVARRKVGRHARVGSASEPSTYTTSMVSPVLQTDVR
jgi:hypothetical protein